MTDNKTVVIYAVIGFLTLVIIIISIVLIAGLFDAGKMESTLSTEAGRRN